MPKREVEVTLISIPDNLLDVIYTACRVCYSNLGAIDIYENITADDDKKLELIKKILSSGHYSTIEHIQLTFAINNLSRAASHQLVRHRHMSFSQKSQRYVKEKGEFSYIIPQAISANKVLLEKFQKHMQLTAQLYQEFIDNSIKSEDARAILPNAFASSMVASLNLRELIHLANLRLCTRAQFEIRLLVKKMCMLVEEHYPWLEEYLVPKCERFGYCYEENSCGRVQKKNG